MPIYEYQCQECEYLLEKLQRVGDAPFKACPACGQQSLQKLVSSVAFRLKGSGWYETDFKNTSPKLQSADKDPSKNTQKNKEDKVAKEGKSSPTDTSKEKKPVSKSDN